MSALRKLGFLTPDKTVFLLCDVQEKFRFMNFFAEFTKNSSKLVSIVIWRSQDRLNLHSPDFQNAS